MDKCIRTMAGCQALELAIVSCPARCQQRMIGDWAKLLSDPADEKEQELLRCHQQFLYQHMITHSVDRSSCGSRHTRILPPRPSSSRGKVECPLSSPFPFPSPSPSFPPKDAGNCRQKIAHCPHCIALVRPPTVQKGALVDLPESE